MLAIEKLDTRNKAHVRRFTRLQPKMYANVPQYVPPLLIDSEMQMNREKHPFYEHSDGDFWIATQDGVDVGRLAVFENKTFNSHRKLKYAQFYFFDSIDDQAVADLLFTQAFEWARKRGLDTIIGPKGLSAMDGYGICVMGHERRQMMNMMNYNFPYYQRLVENLGFEKEVDFNSTYLDRRVFDVPERIHRIVKRVEQRGVLRTIKFNTRADLKAWAQRIGKAYNNAFVNNWEYYPLTEREVSFVLQNLLTYADPKLIKIIAHGDDVVGFLLGFPDVSAGMQKAKGHLLPFGMLQILLDMKRTKWVSLNGVGILPEFQGHGGNAMLYAEIHNTLLDYQFEHCELTQVAETARQMRNDLASVGAQEIKLHRVFRKKL